MLAHSLELLSSAGATRSRRMFGGHGLYIEGHFAALIAGDTLYLKTDVRTRPIFEAAGCLPFVYEGKGRPVTMSYFTVPPEAMESPAAMKPWAGLALQASRAARAGRQVPR